MALNSSGPISIGGSTVGQSINLELGRAATAQSSLNEADLRTLADKASGVISLADFYGKSTCPFSDGVYIFDTGSGIYTYWREEYEPGEYEEYRIYWCGSLIKIAYFNGVWGSSPSPQTIDGHVYRKGTLVHSSSYWRLYSVQRN